VESILYPVPHRQYVFTILRLLRVYFPHNRTLLTEQISLATSQVPSDFPEILSHKARA
jgi:hypothetical protein